MLSVQQVKAARALLGWSQRDLAEASGISLPTIGRLESKDGPLAAYQRTSDALRDAFDRAGIEFLADGAASPAGGPGVRLRGGADVS